jgi:hypothetical protein
MKLIKTGTHNMSMLRAESALPLTSRHVASEEQRAGATIMRRANHLQAPILTYTCMHARPVYVLSIPKDVIRCTQVYCNFCVIPPGFLRTNLLLSLY